MARPPSPPVPPTDAAEVPPAPRARVRRRLAKGRDARQRRKKLWTYGVLVVSTILMVNALMGEKGYLANMQAEREFQKVSESLQQVKNENAALADEARRLKSDPLTLEDAARQQLGLIKPGETLITIRNRPARRP